MIELFCVWKNVCDYYFTTDNMILYFFFLITLLIHMTSKTSLLSYISFQHINKISSLFFCLFVRTCVMQIWSYWFSNNQILSCRIRRTRAIRRTKRVGGLSHVYQCKSWYVRGHELQCGLVVCIVVCCAVLWCGIV